MTTISQDMIQFWAQTDVGRVRDHNEDNFLVDKNINLFIVADGMGGHAAGEVASSVAVKTLAKVVADNKDLIVAYGEDSPIASRKDVTNLLEHGVHKACEDIFRMGEADPGKRGMGTTLSAILVIGANGFLAHVGDSRIYLQRGERVIQLSEDHSLVNELIKRGKLSALNAEDSPYKNAVTRAVGVYETVQVDTMDFDILPGDQFLLASDGLTGYLKDDEIPSLLQLDTDIKDIPAQFIELANDRGGKDNITAVVVRITDKEGKAAQLNRELEEKLQTIARMPLFRYLSEQELLQVMGVTQVSPVAAGQRIVKEGDQGDVLFIVLSGTVKVHKGDTELVTLEAGAHFGEMALVDKAPRSADVSAISDCKLMIISRDAFFDIIKSDPHMANKLLWSFVQELSKRLRSSNDDIGSDGDDDIEDLTEELFGPA